MKRLEDTERFELYEAAVLSPAFEAQFAVERFADAFGTSPSRLREDFCGTAAIARAFVSEDPNRSALAVDIDGDVLAFAAAQKQKAPGGDRVTLQCANVLDLDAPSSVDVISAQNFSWCGLHDRASLLKYLSACRQALLPQGVLLFDLLGGAAREVAGHIDRRDAGPCMVQFRQETFDLVTRRARFHLDFTLRGHTYREAFSYDWRLWTLPETTDLFHEAGISDVQIFFERRDRFGSGTNRFEPVAHAPGEDRFVCYIVGTVGKKAVQERPQ